MATANPAMNPEVYQRAGYADSPADVMTVQGAALKCMLLVGILLITAGFVWTQFVNGQQVLVGPLTGLGAIGGCILAFVTIFFPKAAPWTSPFYAACEGLFLGGVSALVEAAYPGIVLQATSVSVAILALMLFIYATGIIRVTEKLMIGIVAATGAVALVYFATWILGFFGVGIPYIHGSGPIGIAFSAVVVIIAALNLLLDFEFIQQGAQAQAPKYMEWYGAFSLLVTLVWMYLEILRLLLKLQGNSRD